MPDPSPAIARIARGLQTVGLACKVGAGLTLVAIIGVVKLAPDRPTFGLAGVLFACVGGALGPGGGLPMLLTGRMRVRAGLLGVLTGQTGARAPIAQGASVRVFGLLLTLIGATVATLGVGVAATELGRML